MKLNIFLLKNSQNNVQPPNLEFFQWIVFDETAFVSSNMSAFALFSKHFQKHKPVAFYTFGDGFDFMSQMPYSIKRSWVHLQNFDTLTEASVCHNFFTVVHAHPFAKDNPLLSVFTSTFHSGDKILRPLRSLQAQTWTHWEWIVWDDSNDMQTFQALQKFAERDFRIKVFKAPQHSGFIGEMKRLACGVAQGEWLLELDHDDEIDEHLLEWIVQASKAHPDVDFIFTDTCELYENGNSHSYGDHFAFGFGSNVNFWHHGRWMTQTLTQSQNPRTMSHIVGVPNHMRAWKTSFYDRIGKHNALLPVADDFELLLRSFLEGKWLYIPVAAYFQFRNADGNNFTFLRNALIQHCVAWIFDKFKGQVASKFKALEVAPSSELSWDPVWTHEPELFKRLDNVWLPTPFDVHSTVSIVMPTFDRPDELLKAVWSVFAQTDTDWMLFIVGDACPTLQQTMQRFVLECAKDSEKKRHLHRVRWWNLSKHSGMWGAVSRNYGLKMLCKTDWVAYLDDDNTWTPEHLTSMRKAAAEKPAAEFVLASMLVEGKPILCDKPEFKRVDASSFMHKRSLAERFGGWPMQNVGYANDWTFVEKWVDADVPWAVTLEPTLVYNTTNNSQTFESISQK